jgi:hypothetical protein
MALEAITPPLPVTSVPPSAVCLLDVSNATVTRKLQAALRYSASEPEMTKYLKDRHDWDDVTVQRCPFHNDKFSVCAEILPPTPPNG